jgi:hypothetical protein
MQLWNRVSENVDDSKDLPRVGEQLDPTDVAAPTPASSSASGVETARETSFSRPTTADPGGYSAPLAGAEQSIAVAPRATLWRRWPAAVWGMAIVGPLRIASLLVLLGLLSVIPVAQLAALGYFFEVSGRLGRGGRWRDSLPLLEPAGRLGLALLAIFVVALPIRLVSYWSYTAELIAPGNPRAGQLQLAALGLVAVGGVWLAWAWIRGGRLRHYVWPQPVRFFREFWRPSTWATAADRLWNFCGLFQLPRLWWLGLRGAVATLIWISLPALLIIGATRDGETGLAGLVGVVGMAMMGFVVMYLPMLQAQFATENSWRAMFAWRRVRARFRVAPLAFWIATSLTLVLAVPLYLLKIEATPKEVVWLPAVFFIAFMLPAHWLTGWAIHRTEQREAGRRWWHKLPRVACRVLTVPIVLGYLLFVYVSQLTSWDGMATWFNQHAFLVPVPFVGT